MPRNQRIDETGNRYSRLLVIEHAGQNKRGSALWFCRCDCGQMLNVKGSSLRSGNTRSCGCLKREADKQKMKIIHNNNRNRIYTHGLSNHPLYQTWDGIKRRCLNPNDKRYEGYGGRGIRMYDPWTEDPRLFIEWIDANLGPRPEGHTLDRISVNGNYEPGNLRWANAKLQSWNRRAANQVHPDFYKLLTEPIEFVYRENDLLA